MKFKSISVLIPVYNEINTIKECIDRVLKSNTWSRYRGNYFR